LQQENFIATKTPGQKGFFFLLFTNVFFYAPGVSEATFLAKKERRNTGGINSPVRANWMGQEVAPRFGYLKTFLAFRLLPTLCRSAAKHFSLISSC